MGLEYSCEDRTEIDDFPCDWPYSKDSGCRETYAEEVGSLYEGLTAFFLILSLACLFVMYHRVLCLLIDAGFIRHPKVIQVYGIEKRIKQRFLHHYDRLYILLTVILTFYVLMMGDYQAWRGVYGWEAYRIFRTFNNYLFYILFFNIVDHMLKVSYLMYCSVLTPDLDVASANRHERRFVAACMWITAIGGIVSIGGIFSYGEEAVEDNRFTMPVALVVNVLVLVATCWGLYATARILSYLENANRQEREAHFKSVGATHLSPDLGRMERRERAIRTTRNQFICCVLGTICVNVYIFSTAPDAFENPRFNIETPCDLASMFDPALVISIFCAIAIVFIGPNRKSSGNRRINSNASQESMEKGSSKRSMKTKENPMYKPEPSTHSRGSGKAPGDSKEGDQAAPYVGAAGTATSATNALNLMAMTPPGGSPDSHV